MSRIAFGDAGDHRVIAATAALAQLEGIIPVLINPGRNVTLPAGVEAVSVDAEVDPLTFLANYVSRGDADAGIAGSLSSSASVIRAGIRGLGTRGLVTGCFLMERHNTKTTYADCSVVPNPSAEQLADIAAAAADHHRLSTGATPLVAMLSFSTKGSAEHATVSKVRTATKLLRKRRPDLIVEGEMQFDVAVDAEVGRRKLPDSQVAGRANVLVFPTLDAGNIAYKVAERVGGARALGSFVLNLNKPWVDLSRGCSAQDLIDTAQLVANLHLSDVALNTDQSERTAQAR